MRHLKKTIVFLLSLTMVLALFSGTAFAEEPEAAAAETEALSSGPETERIVPESLPEMTETKETEEILQKTDEEEQAAADGTAYEGLPTETGETVPEEVRQGEQIQITEKISVDPALTGDSDELLTDYINISLGVSARALYSTQNAGKRLTGTDLATYTTLKEWAEKVASGEVTGTIVTLKPLGLGLKESYTAADLGLTSLGTGDEVSDEAVNALRGLLPNPRRVNLALLLDCPYELFWYDKSIDDALTYQFSVDHTSAKDGTVTSVSIPGVVYRFTVSEEYADQAIGKTPVNVDGKTIEHYYNVDAAKLGAVQTALKNIKSIVAENASKSGYDKLKAYKDKIDELVEYHPTAMKDPSTPYGNPWQLVWVFDGNPETKVVCEGYSKAFQYLCDLSSLGKIGVRTVTGKLYTGGRPESHMWNLVTMEDGKNYLVDVTNCDTGTAGYPDKLFLAGGIGSGSFDYTIAGVSYTYDDDTRSIYTAEELKLSAANYGEPDPTPTSKEKLAFDRSGGNQLVKGTEKNVLLTVSGLNPKYAYPSVSLNVGIYNETAQKFSLLLEMGTDYQIVETKGGFQLTFSYDTVKKVYKAKGKKDSVLSMYAQLTDNDGTILTKDFYSLRLLEKKVKQTKVKASGAAAAKEESESLIKALESSESMGIPEDLLFESLDMDQIWEKALSHFPDIDKIPDEAEFELNVFLSVELLGLDTDDAGNVTVLLLDITPVYEVLYWENEEAEGKVIAEGKIPLSGPVEMQIPVGDLFDGGKEAPEFLIRHTHEGKEFLYPGTLKTDETGTYVSFLNPNGFSQFMILAGSLVDEDTDPSGGSGSEGSAAGGSSARAEGAEKKTGDTQELLFWVLMAAASLTAAAAAAVFAGRRKKSTGRR